MAPWAGIIDGFGGPSRAKPCVEPGFEVFLADAGVTVQWPGREPGGRTIELDNRPFFCGHAAPQKRWRPNRPHPVLIGFANAIRLNRTIKSPSSAGL